MFFGPLIFAVPQKCKSLIANGCCKPWWRSEVPNMRLKSADWVATFAVAVLVSAQTVTAQQYTYTSIDFPGAMQTSAAGINDSDQVVGNYEDNSGAYHGFLWSAGQFTSIDFPSAPGGAVSGTVAMGINNTGQIVGYYFGGGGNGCHGFLLSGGSFSSFDFPSASNLVCTLPMAINDSGEIVGDYQYNGGKDYGGFLLSSAGFQAINYPTLPETNVFCVSLSGQIFGEGYTIPTGASQTFSYSQGAFTPVPYLVYGINAKGDLLFPSGIQEGGQFVSFNYPSANSTAPRALNNLDAVAGIYWSNGNYNLNHAFVAVPAGAVPLPPSTFFGTPGTTANPTASVAEPVNTATGDFFSSHTDLVVRGKGLVFDFARSYNSLDSYSGPLGSGWTHSYNILLSQDGAGNVTVKQGDGGSIGFAPSGGGNYTASTRGVFDVLQKNGDGSFTLTRKSQLHLNFSPAGKLASIVDRNGNTQTMSYDSSGNLVSVLDSSGRQIILTYDSNQHLISLKDPIGRQLQFAYDGNGNLVSYTDPSGAVTQYAYDASHRMISATDANSNVYVQNSYDSQGRVILQKNARGFTTTFAYNTPSSGTTTITDPLGNVAQHVYDAQTRLIQIVNAQGQMTSLTYDANNDRTSVTDANGHKTSFTYDGRGNITGVTNPLGDTATFSYDAKNNLLSATSPTGKTTSLSYDTNSNLISVQNPLSNTTSFSYDGFGELIARIDALGHSASLGYDSAGNLIQITNALGKTTSLGYDTVGRLVSVTDPNGHTRKSTYDPLSRIVKLVDALGNQTLFGYDLVGDLVKLTNANGKVTTYTFDSTYNLLSVTDALGNVTGYGYDANNNRTTFTNAKGKTTTYSYDALNRLVKTTDPLSHVTSYLRDAMGNVVAATNPDGKTNRFGYDALNRRTGISYADGSTVGYSYDANGDRIRMVDPHGTTQYKYDALNRIVSVTDPAGKVVSYGYDAVGNRDLVTYPDGTTVRYAFDAVNRLHQVTDWLGKISDYEYDPSNNLLEARYPNGAGMEYGYDAANRLVEVTDSRPKSRRQVFRYTLDPVGNRIALCLDDDVTAFEYDGRNELISARLGIWKTIWTYDAVGNRVEEFGPARWRTYSYDDADRLLRAGIMTFSYDAAGNQLSRRFWDETTHYSYDAANRLISVVGPHVNNSFGYDGDGNRVTQTTRFGTYVYVNDVARAFPSVLDEYGPDGKFSYAYGHGLMEISGAAHDYFYQYDGLGSVVALTTAQGKVLASYDYDSWGNSFSHSGLAGTRSPFRYTGESLDAETGLYYLRARYYDPTIGRFISKDQLPGLAIAPLTTNPYAYGGNNPLRYTDHSGMASQPTGSNDMGLRSGSIMGLVSTFVSVTYPPPSPGSGTSRVGTTGVPVPTSPITITGSYDPWSFGSDYLPFDYGYSGSTNAYINYDVGDFNSPASPYNTTGPYNPSPQPFPYPPPPATTSDEWNALANQLYCASGNLCLPSGEEAQHGYENPEPIGIANGIGDSDWNTPVPDFWSP